MIKGVDRGVGWGGFKWRRLILDQSLFDPEKISMWTMVGLRFPCTTHEKE